MQNQHWEQDYIALIKNIVRKGNFRSTRNGNTYSLFGEKLEIDMLKGGFPILQGRKMNYKAPLGEFAACIRGPRNVEDFKKFGCNYWDYLGDRDGKINLDYGNTWFEGGLRNQLDDVIYQLKNFPTSRRIIIDSWRPERLHLLDLPCCHFVYQWYVNPNTGELDMIIYQRSADVMLGLPNDIVFMAAFNTLLAKEVDLYPRKLIFMIGDAHIYAKHIDNTYNYLGGVEDFDFKFIEYTLNKNSRLKTFIPSDLDIDYENYLKPLKFELL